MRLPGPLQRAKAALRPYAARAHGLLYQAASRTWGGRPLVWYRRARTLSQPQFARARRALRRLLTRAASAAPFEPPPAFAILPRKGASTAPALIIAHVRTAAAALPGDDPRRLLSFLQDVAEPASSLLSAEIIARSGDADRALSLLWGVRWPGTLSDMGLTALAPLAQEHRAQYRAEAEQALSGGFAARASERYRLALALDPDAEDLRVGLARALAAQDRLAEARLVLARLLEHNPQHHGAAALRADLQDD